MPGGFPGDVDTEESDDAEGGGEEGEALRSSYTFVPLLVTR